MFKISSKLKDSFKYTNSSKITGVFIRKAHLFAFLLLFSPMWQHDGNRCSQINECKMTSNHPHFSCVDVLASTLTQKMRNSNLSQKITDMSYETDYLTCKSRGWFRTVTVLVCPRFWAPACVPECARVCVFVRACVSVLAEACEWQAVSERDVIIWLMSVRVVSRGRVTSLAASWHSVDRKHYFMISPREESTLVTLGAATTQSHFAVFPPRFTKKKSRIFTTIIWKRPPEPFISCFFLQELFFLSSFISFVPKASKRGLSPHPVLTLWLLLCNNNAQVLVQCPAVDLRVRW